MFRKKCEAKLEKSQSGLKGPVRGAVAQTVGWDGEMSAELTGTEAGHKG